MPKFLPAFLFFTLASACAVGLFFVLGFAGAAKDRHIVCIQQHLKGSGHYDGPIDGALGEETIGALRAVKRANPGTAFPRLVELNTPAVWCESLETLDKTQLAGLPLSEQNRAADRRKDFYVQCVEEQLASLEHYPGTSDGRPDDRLKLALVAFAERQRDDVAAASRASPDYHHWCKRIGIVRPDMKQFWPAKQALNTRVTFRTDNNSETKRAAETAYNEARQFFLHTYGVDIRTPVGLSVASNGEEAMANLNSLLARQNRSARHFAKRWIDRCARTTGNSEHVDGMVFRHTVLLCGVDFNGDPRHDVRIRAALTRTMVHEYVHLLQGELSKQGPTTQRTTFVSGKAHGWLVEGTATYFTSQYLKTVGRRHHSERTLRRWVNRNNGNQLENLAGRSVVRAYRDYRLSELGITYLVELSGEDALFDYFRFLGRGRSSEQAFKAAFGISTREFYRNFENGFRVAG